MRIPHPTAVDGRRKSKVKVQLVLVCVRHCLLDYVLFWITPCLWCDDMMPRIRHRIGIRIDADNASATDPGHTGGREAETSREEAEHQQPWCSYQGERSLFFYFGVFCLLDFAPIITSFKIVLLSLSEQSVTCYPEMLEKKKDKVLSYTKKCHSLPESDDYRSSGT